MTQPGSPGSQLPPGPDALVRRMRELEQRLSTLEHQRSLESATIGKGGLTVQDNGSIRVIDTGGTIWDSDRDLSVPVGWTAQVGGLNFTGAWVNYMDSTILDIPYGMTRITIMINAMAGETLGGSPGVGSLSVSSAIEWFDAAGVSLSVGGGIAVNSGQSQIPVAYSFTTLQATLPANFRKFRIGASVADSIGTSTRVAGSGNWAAAVLAVFSRA